MHTIDTNRRTKEERKPEKRMFSLGAKPINKAYHGLRSITYSI